MQTLCFGEQSPSEMQTIAMTDEEDGDDWDEEEEPPTLATLLQLAVAEEARNIAVQSKLPSCAEFSAMISKSASLVRTPQNCSHHEKKLHPTDHHDLPPFNKNGLPKFETHNSFLVQLPMLPVTDDGCSINAPCTDYTLLPESLGIPAETSSNEEDGTSYDGVGSSVSNNREEVLPTSYAQQSFSILVPESSAIAHEALMPNKEMELCAAFDENESTVKDCSKHVSGAVYENSAIVDHEHSPETESTGMYATFGEVAIDVDVPESATCEKATSEEGNVCIVEEAIAITGANIKTIFKEAKEERVCISGEGQAIAIAEETEAKTEGYCCGAIEGEAAAEKRGQLGMKDRRKQSLTDSDFRELKGCIDLGFSFDKNSAPELSHILPALEVYSAVSHGFHGRPSSVWRVTTPGDSPDDVKKRLRYWAQAVACNLKLCHSY